MFDALHVSYRFSCPERESARVRVSAFRVVERLEGPRRPATYRIRFACDCGDEHWALESQDQLDVAPIGSLLGTYANLMTGTLDFAGDELLPLAADRIRRGEWPWTMVCCREEKLRPAVPSGFVRIVELGDERGVLVRCMSCGALSLNVVSRAHLDDPFHNDREIAVVGLWFRPDQVGLGAEALHELRPAA